MENVKVVLLKHGTSLGNMGDTVEVAPAVAQAMCRKRTLYDGTKDVEYRVARLASEP
jgi:hypothetical protein